MNATCRSCGAPILWAISLAGILSPIDPIPVANGNVALDLDRDPPLATFDSAKTREQKAAPGPRYLSHFATCPDAKKWKGKK